MTAQTGDQKRLFTAILLGFAVHILLLALFLLMPRMQAYTPKPLIGPVEVTLDAPEVQETPIIQELPQQSPDPQTPSQTQAPKPRPQATPGNIKPTAGKTAPPQSTPNTPAAPPEYYEPEAFQEFAIPVPPPPAKSTSTAKPSASVADSELNKLLGEYSSTSEQTPGTSTPAAAEDSPKVIAIGGAKVTMEGAKEGRKPLSTPVPGAFPAGTLPGILSITFKVNSAGQVQPGSIKPASPLNGGHRDVYETLKKSIQNWTFSPGKPNGDLITVTVSFTINTY